MSSAFTLSRRTFLIAPIALAACKSSQNVVDLSGQTMGTSYSVTLVDHSKSLSRSTVKDAIEAQLASVNAQMSNWDAGSEVSRFNVARSTDPMPVSRELAQVVQAAQDVRAASDGQFDIALGPLIDLWGFGAQGATQAMPDEVQIAAALEASGQKLHVENGALRKSDPNVQIYLSAIGKGHGVDRVAKAIESLGVRDYLVEIGGDLYAAGLNPDGQPWQIGIETPDAQDRGVQSIASVSGLGMATSGDYRNYFERDGQRYSHILDATSGRPITHRTTSATVLTENAMLADAWATAMLTLGSERGLEVATAHDLAVLFVDRGASNDLSDLIVTPSPAFQTLMG